MWNDLINPNNIKWKYFYLDKFGDLKSTDDRPSSQENITALLNTSMWFPPRKTTPESLRKCVTAILNQEIDGEKPNLCLTLPCEDLGIMQEYYGIEANINSEIDEEQKLQNDFISLRVHNDLRKGNIDFEDLGIRAIRTMPPKEGAEQIASAIEHGFDIWSFAGGNSLLPKLILCEKYFVQKSLEATPNNYLSGKKSKVVSFSNGSNFHKIRNLVDFVHGFGMINAVFGKEEESKNITLNILQGKNPEIVRNLKAISENDFRQIQEKYLLVKEDKKLSNVTLFGFNLGNICDSNFLPTQNDEMIILGLEGFYDSGFGDEIHEALLRSLSCGAIKPTQILFISIEDIVARDEMFEIERVNGEIPQYDFLSERGKEFVDKKVQNLGITKENYILNSNQKSKEETQKIIEVARAFNIPVVNGGINRAGHSKGAATQTSAVESLEFDFNKQQIIQKSTLRQENKEELLSLKRKDTRKNSKPQEWKAISPITGEIKSYEYSRELIQANPNDIAQTELSNTKLANLNDKYLAQKLDKEQIIGGNVINLGELPAREFVNKGLLLNINANFDPDAKIHQIIDSDQFKAAKFAIISMDIPENFRRNEGYVQYRNTIFEKIVKDFQVDKPVLITNTVVNQSNLTSLFSAELDLKKMLGRKREDPSTEMNILANSSKKLKTSTNERS